MEKVLAQMLGKQASSDSYTQSENKNIYPPLVFSNTTVAQSNFQKYIGVTLDLKLT